MIRQRGGAPVPFTPDRLRRSAQFGGAFLTEAQHPGGAAIPSHLHAVPTLTFVLAGEFSEKNPLRSGETVVTGLLFRPAAVLHLNRIGAGGVRTLGVCLQPDCPSGPWNAAAALPDAPVHVADGRTRFMAARLHAEMRAPDDLSRISVESIVSDILVGMVRADRSVARGARPPRWLVRAWEAANDRFRERGLTLRVLARDAGVEPATLARGFRGCFGVSVGQFLRRRRLDLALRLIQSDGIAIAQAAAEAGFVDQSHLTRVCRRLAGDTPARLLKDSRAGDGVDGPDGSEGRRR